VDSSGTRYKWRAFVKTNGLLTAITYNFLYIYATSRSLRANPLFKTWFSTDFISNIHRHLPVTGLHYCTSNLIYIFVNCK